jgi:hypothetical protein
MLEDEELGMKKNCIDRKKMCIIYESLNRMNSTT